MRKVTHLQNVVISSLHGMLLNLILLFIRVMVGIPMHPLFTMEDLSCAIVNHKI